MDRPFTFVVLINNSSVQVLTLRTTSQQKRGEVPRSARIQGCQMVASLNSGLESNKEKKKKTKTFYEPASPNQAFEADRTPGLGCGNVG